MDSQSREQNPELSRFQSPTTPSIPPTLDAPNGTVTPASELKSSVWLVARPPGTLLVNANEEPLYDGEHARVLQTPFGDIASIETNSPGSRAIRRSKRHPTGTEYSLVEDIHGSNEAGRMVGVLKVINHSCVNGSEFGLPGGSLVVVARETIFKPLFADPCGHADNNSQQPPAESETTSRVTGSVGGSLEDGSRRSRQSRE